MNKERLKEILMEEDVVNSINVNLDELLSMIPEMRAMIGFEHKHPHHHLDVFNHTLLALSRAPLDFKIRVVLLLHDLGKPYSCQEGEIRHFKNHPQVSSVMSYDIFTRLGFSKEEIDELCYLIKEHDNLINDEDISENIDLVKIRFKIQFCDALAHHPDKLEKRINYLLKINEKINDDFDKENYQEILNNILCKRIEKKNG